MKVRIKKMKENAIIPTYGTEFSAGADLYSALDVDSVSIEPGDTFMVGTGVGVEIPNGYVGLIFARSGLASKQGLAPANKVGVIDSDYRGEIKVALHNHSNKVQSVKNGDRIAQFVIIPYIQAQFEEVDELEESVRGAGGFGSTGV